MSGVMSHALRWSIALGVLGFAVALSMTLVPTTHGQGEPPDTSLEQGWNLVPWGAGPDTEATGSGLLGVVWAWDATTQGFQSFNPNLPGASPPAWNADTPVWVHNAGEDALAWSLPTITGARAVPLVAGWNLEIWTGPDAFPIGQAVTALEESVQAVWLWDATEQRYLVYRPNSGALPSSLAALNRYDGVWLQMRDAALWEQPAATGSGAAPPLAIAVNPALDHLYLGGLDAVIDSVAVEIRSANGVVLFAGDIAGTELEQVSASVPLSEASFPLGILVPPEAHGVDIVPGLLVEVSSGGRSGALVVDSITIQEFDPALDAVLITGPPRGVFDLWVLRESAGSIVIGYVLSATGRAVLSRSAIAAIVGGDVVWLAANSPSSALGDPFSTLALAGGATVGPE